MAREASLQFLDNSITGLGVRSGNLPNVLQHTAPCQAATPAAKLVGPDSAHVTHDSKCLNGA